MPYSNGRWFPIPTKDRKPTQPAQIPLHAPQPYYPPRQEQNPSRPNDRNRDGSFPTYERS